MVFRDDFAWGAATAAYQIEGAHTSDGKGWSVWDEFTHYSGKVWQSHTGDVACDHYHRYKDDVVLMRQIGMNGYRFSVSWARVLPQGIGDINPEGIGFYDRLVDELLDVGITPFATLYHWDMPYALYQRGGWLNRDVADWFANYADVVARHLGDRVKNWITLNEPTVFINDGHFIGRHAPGEKRTSHEILMMVHHTLLAHGQAVQALRACVADGHVGMAFAVSPPIPLDDSPEAIQKARDYLFLNRLREGSFRFPELWSEPIFKGAYPSTAYERLPMPDFAPSDFDIITQPLDFIGLNTYTSDEVKISRTGDLSSVIDVQTPRTRFDWPVTPEALYWGSRFFYERYQLPIYITENGISSMDWVTLEGTVPDTMRIDFTHRYLCELRRAVADGVDVRGYFHWSLMDNFEWADGYKQRFGLIYVDFKTQERLLKASAHWYRDVIQANGDNL